MRLFVAAYPPPAACDDLEPRLAGLHLTRAADRGVNTRPARRDSWHVTLAFLGEVTAEAAPLAAAALDRAAGGWRAAGDRPPELRLAGGGRFGRGRFTVLWVGLTGDTETLTRLAGLIRGELRHDRLPCDDRPFTPHLTIARPGDRLSPAEIDQDRAALSGYRGPTWPVASIELVRSHLGPRTAHERLGSYPLSS